MILPSDLAITFFRFLIVECPGTRVYRLDFRLDSESHAKTSFVTFSFS